MSLENMLSIPTLNSLNMYSGVCMCVCVCAHSLHGLHCPYRSSHEVLLQQELQQACHWVWFLMRLSPALFFSSFCVFFSSFLFLRYIHSFGSHAEPRREGSSCRARAGWVGVGRASKQQVLFWFYSCQVREWCGFRLNACALALKDGKRSSVTLEIRVEGRGEV